MAEGSQRHEPKHGAVIRRRTLISGAIALAASPAALKAAADGLRAIVVQCERRSGGRLGVAVHDLQGRRHFGYRADERFPIYSSFKLLLAALALTRCDRGIDRLDRVIPVHRDDIVPASPFTQTRVGKTATLEDLCRAIMTLSDNTAANLLMRAAGGPSALTAFIRSLGDGTTRIDHYEPMLGAGRNGDADDTTTPSAMADNLRRLLFGSVLEARSADRLLGWMLANLVGDRRLRAGVPTGWRVGDRTGTNDGTANDVAVLFSPAGETLLVAVYLTGAKLDPPQLDVIHAQVGRAVADASLAGRL